MTLSADPHVPDRRAFLRRAGLAVAAGASLPLLNSAPSPAFASAGNPDQLFKEGRFAAAERGYRHLLREDPRNAHAFAQVGYIALLSNRFRDAEKHLSKAVDLQSGDVASAQRLAECFIRQDQPARAVSLLQSTVALATRRTPTSTPTSAASHGRFTGRRARTCPSPPWILCLPSKPP